MLKLYFLLAWILVLTQSNMHEDPAKVKYSPGRSTMNFIGNWNLDGRNLNVANLAQYTNYLVRPLTFLADAAYIGHPIEISETCFFVYILSFWIVKSTHQHNIKINHQEYFPNYGTADLVIQPDRNNPAVAAANPNGQHRRSFVVELKRYGTDLWDVDIQNQMCDMILGFEDVYGWVPVGILSSVQETYFYSCTTRYNGAAGDVDNGECDCYISVAQDIFTTQNQYEDVHRDTLIEFVETLDYAFSYSDLVAPAQRAAKATNHANPPLIP